MISKTSNINLPKIFNGFSPKQENIILKSKIYSIKDVINSARKYFASAAIFSGIINILMLSGSLFMLQVYDRVLPSHSIPTLLALVVLVIILYCLSTLLETARSRLFSRIGRHFDMSLRDAVFEANMKAALPGNKPAANLAFKDLEQIRSFLAGGGPSAIFDLPWMPIYSIMLFMLHPYIGLLGVAGIIALSIITWLNDKATTPHQQASSNIGQDANAFAESVRISVETISPMGMMKPLKDIWLSKNQKAGEAIILSSDKLGVYGGISRFLRMALQSMMLALGAYLVITGKGTGGVMIASSIILGKALAPVELAISHWRGLVSARQSYHRLEECLQEAAAIPKIKLPQPSSKLSIQGLFLTVPNVQQPILSNINFEAVAGDAIGIIGPSGAGKSTLARALVGVWPIAKGHIRFDGSTLDQWSEDEIGKFIGYVPQAIELFSGTIGQNISRFKSDASSEKIIKAAQLAGMENFIRNIEGGFDAEVGPRGSRFSAGQRQRLALARALYDDPFILVMDEPNSALDAEGELALIKAITEVRKRGGIAIIIAHRPNVLQSTNKVLVLGNGQQQAFGPREEVFKQVLNAPATQSANNGATQ